MIGLTCLSIGYIFVSTFSVLVLCGTNEMSFCKVVS
jgi:hypothetical protein